ncbi:MAG: D-tyrosyl-tRNA(Tyr) deacylase [Deltaproteobacteria bacterium]|nr:D-tyrosyl-tRNA(Tyr) deacylase [Deltaproteobacteria bacterium]
MRAVVQRVRFGRVEVGGAVAGEIGAGLLVLLSVAKDDTPADRAYLVDKVAGLRIFADEAGRMNLDVRQAGGAILLVSQFTLHGDVRRGRRPGFTDAMAPEGAAPEIERVAAELRALGLGVAQGVFGADMQVTLCNDGPVTILLDSKKVF